MNKPNHLLMSLASSALFCGLVVSGSTLSAQQTPDQQSSPSAPAAQPQQQPPAPAPDQSAPAQPNQATPDASAQAQPSNGQIYAGTVTKAGEKYVLQMSDGTAYDLDHQDLVKKYEGKQVRVKGTMDQDGKTIHITQ